jgi:hypothetical protein
MKNLEEVANEILKIITKNDLTLDEVMQIMAIIEAKSDKYRRDIQFSKPPEQPH